MDKVTLATTKEALQARKSLRLCKICRSHLSCRQRLVFFLRPAIKFFKGIEKVVRMCLLNQRLEDLVTIVVELDVLSDYAHDGKHCQPSVVDFLVLVVNPALVAVVNPVGST